MRIALEPNSRIDLFVGSGTREYVIDNTVGSGATCIVYSAHYEDAAGHKRFVRIKECYPHDTQITRNGLSLRWADTSVKSMMLERFRNAYQKLSEMQNTQGLRNSTAHVFDLCESNGTLYSVMDMNEGKTFDHDSTCSLQDILKTTLALTRVIEKYHANGYLHLDIKPSNFLVLPETRELVILFDVDSVTPLTEIRTGNISSIPYSKGWAAPEQMQGKLQKLCPATDLYAIGAILFERVFARPVSSEDMGIFARWNYGESLCANENPKIRRLLTDIFHKTLAANIQNRYRSAAELSAALEDAIRVVDKGTPYLTAVAPTSYINFVGRQEELRRIFQTFDSGKKCIFLQGFGGIGKTELAKKYAEIYSGNYDHVVFLRHSEKQSSLKFWLLENLQIANYEDDHNDSEPERHNKRLEKIKNLLTPRVLVILDNYDVETPDSEFMELLDWNASWLVTTRTDFSCLDGQTAQISVGQMAFPDLLEIFCRESKLEITETQKAALEKLFNHFDNYTMVVTLLAKQVYAAGLTIEELCDSEDIYNYEERVVSAKDATVTQDTLLGHLQRVFNVAALSKEQQEALRTVWMMQDANEVTKQFYKKYSGMSLNSLNPLISLGWLQYDGKCITLHPVIAQLIERALEPCCENCPHLYHTFLEKLSALRDAIDRDDSSAYAGETETLFRIYAYYMYATDNKSDENLLRLSMCLLDLYEQYEVPEFMWFNGWENQDYLLLPIAASLGSVVEHPIEIANASKQENTIPKTKISPYGAYLICDFCMMQLENIKNDPYEYDQIYAVPEDVYLVYAWALRDFLQEISDSNTQTMALLQSRVQKDRGYFDGCSISPDGRYNSDYEDGDPYPVRAFADEDDWCGTYPCDDFIINPHASDTNLAMYRTFYCAVTTVLDAHEKGHLTLADSEQIEYKTLKNQMFMELVRCFIGNDHFYDFYHIPEEWKNTLESRLMTMKKIDFSIQVTAPYLDNDDESPSEKDYFEEIVETLQTTEHPLYLYKLLVNNEFRISDYIKQQLVDWNLANHIISNPKVTEAEKGDILRLALEMVPHCNECHDPCGSETSCWPSLQRHVIVGIINSL